ncbi:MarR family transcriptional regulator [Sesbania bispinosa]|nr:MarR family transcriptional regulator [Sesbania bispinosa]
MAVDLSPYRVISGLGVGEIEQFGKVELVNHSASLVASLATGSGGTLKQERVDLLWSQAGITPPVSFARVTVTF